jgi:Family of unknown function (DUF5335)
MREVDVKDWQNFCQRINQQREGAAVTIEVMERNGIQIEKGRDLIFESMVLDTQGACNDVIKVHARNAREIEHEILEPIHIRLREVDEHGTFNSIAIEAENGTTFLTFHPAIHGQMLQGLKLT